MASDHHRQAERLRPVDREQRQRPGAGQNSSFSATGESLRETRCAGSESSAVIAAVVLPRSLRSTFFAAILRQPRSFGDRVIARSTRFSPGRYGRENAEVVARGRSSEDPGVAGRTVMRTVASQLTSSGSGQAVSQHRRSRTTAALRTRGTPGRGPADRGRRVQRRHRRRREAPRREESAHSRSGSG